VAEIACGYDEVDPFSRPEADTFRFTIGDCPPHFRFGVPRASALDFLGDAHAAEPFARARARLTALGGEPVEIDFAPFRDAGALVYGGAFLAERLVAAGRLLAEHPEALVGPVRTILQSASTIPPGAALETARHVARARRHAARVFADLDFLLVPTTPTIFSIEAIEADPLGRNAVLGTYTTFVNPLDLAAVAVPTGFRGDRLPAGATLVGPWGSDARLAAFAAALHRATSQELGATGKTFPPPSSTIAPSPPGWIPIAVLGAHLSGEPLNHQLTDAGGRFLRAARTAARYRFYALPDTTPPKPGLARVAGDGVAVDLEIWSLPPAAFGTFVARIPAPLCIGRIEVEDGSLVSGFLCEGHALTGARDISEFGGWRAYRRSLAER
jgi:allophanate hydrolase